MAGSWLSQNQLSEPDVHLNIDRGLTAFIVGDSPLRLQSDGTTLIHMGFKHCIGC